MALLTESSLKSLARKQDKLIRESLKSRRGSECSQLQKFDIFLSYHYDDWELIEGLYDLLIGNRFTVYVDAFCDPQLDRNRVKKATAEVVRERLNQSRMLLYAFTEGAPKSRWMPWELGYFDGSAKRIAIAPITTGERNLYRGVEFLSLYPYLDITSGGTLWINQQNANNFEKLESWIHSTSVRLLLS
jgi:hypothetical protein